MPVRDVVVVGASAGGVEALATLAHGLPANLPAALFVVLHLPPDARSNLPSILDRAGPLTAVHAEDGAPIHPCRIYVALPNRHLTLEGDRMRLSIGPRINSLRPSIDVLFRSAARSFGARVIGVVLSGTLDDGTLGLDAIKLRGGVAIIQDPNEARFSGMPRSAIERVEADHVVPVAEIPALLKILTVGSASKRPTGEGSNAVEPVDTSIVTIDAAAPSPRAQQSYLDQAAMVQTQASLLRNGLARMIQTEENGAPGQTAAATIDPDPMEGGRS